jgi:hypothetical protein
VGRGRRGEVGKAAAGAGAEGHGEDGREDGRAALEDGRVTKLSCGRRRHVGRRRWGKVNETRARELWKLVAPRRGVTERTARWRGGARRRGDGVGNLE